MARGLAAVLLALIVAGCSQTEATTDGLTDDQVGRVCSITAALDDPNDRQAIGQALATVGEIVSEIGLPTELLPTDLRSLYVSLGGTWERLGMLEIGYDTPLVREFLDESIAGIERGRDWLDQLCNG
jgi:hypothetical protein